MLVAESQPHPVGQSSPQPVCRRSCSQPFRIVVPPGSPGQGLQNGGAPLQMWSVSQVQPVGQSSPHFNDPPQLSPTVPQ